MDALSTEAQNYLIDWAATICLVELAFIVFLGPLANLYFAHKDTLFDVPVETDTPIEPWFEPA